jgi:hypothetical protein
MIHKVRRSRRAIRRAGLFGACERVMHRALDIATSRERFARDMKSVSQAGDAMRRISLGEGCAYELADVQLTCST